MDKPILTDRCGAQLRRFHGQSLAGTALLAGLLGVALYLMGRVAWCESGIGFCTGEAAGNCTSQHFADPYSFTHVLHGFILFWLLGLPGKLSLRGRYLAALAVEMAWEILENTPWVIERYRNQTAAFGYTGDSILNAIGDLLCCAAGFVMAARLPAKFTLALALIVELTLLAMIRDNLTLNVLMLVFPIQAVKDWQLAG